VATDKDSWGYQGKRVVVTGAASGMGLACTKILDGLGASVIALDLVRPETAVSTFVETDMADPASIEAAAGAIDAPVNAVFNVVGIPPVRPGVQVMTVNFIGPRHLTELLLPKMPAGSAIACVATILVGLDQAMASVRDVLAISGFDDTVAWAEAHPDVVAEGYLFSKQCVCGYTLHRAPELISRGIRINTIGPSTTDTPFIGKLAEVMSPEAADQATTVIGRRSTAEEQAYPLVFLNSAMASYMTGAVIPNDGGYTAALATGQLAEPTFALDEA
jgi:NAD(P)-dependent dehydrogenase (short-subunit alcohol dehydrogenase family)